MGESRVVAIHQPNFFPWLGFFDKLRRADVFVMLDDVQLALGRGGKGNWANRVRVLVNKAPAWVTAPVRRTGRGPQAIRAVELADEQPWRSKLLKTLRASYGRADAFDEVMPCVTELIEFPAASLCDFNLHAIECFCARLGINGPRIVRQRDLSSEGQGTDLLVKLIQELGGTTYLCGDGADGYLEPDLFARAGVGLAFQNFQHPRYPQRGVAEFVPGLSIIDALMHLGFAQVRALIEGPAAAPEEIRAE